MHTAKAIEFESADRITYVVNEIWGDDIEEV